MAGGRKQQHRGQRKRQLTNRPGRNLRSGRQRRPGLRGLRQRPGAGRHRLMGRESHRTGKPLRQRLRGCWIFDEDLVREWVDPWRDPGAGNRHAYHRRIGRVHQAAAVRKGTFCLTPNQNPCVPISTRETRRSTRIDHSAGDLHLVKGFQKTGEFGKIHARSRANVGSNGFPNHPTTISINGLKRKPSRQGATRSMM